jgi:hypothetical protein
LGGRGVFSIGYHYYNVSLITGGGHLSKEIAMKKPALLALAPVPVAVAIAGCGGSGSSAPSYGGAKGQTL